MLQGRSNSLDSWCVDVMRYLPSEGLESMALRVRLALPDVLTGSPISNTIWQRVEYGTGAQ